MASLIFSGIFLINAILFLRVAGSPIIFDESVKYCNYLQDGRKDLYIETLSETQSVPINLTHSIYFKTCGSFQSHEECPTEAVACLKHAKLNQTFVLGSKLILDEDDDMLLISNNARNCSQYSIAIQLKAFKEGPLFTYNDKTCTYTVTTKYSNIYKKTNCGTHINGRYFSFAPLDITYTLYTEKTWIVKNIMRTEKMNFSVTFCGSNPKCGDGNNACEVTNNSVIPISATSSVEPNFIGGDNQVVIIGKTVKGATKKTDKRFEVFLKCDWDKVDVRNEDLKYVHKQTQGRRYTFELYTSYGCVKRFIPCELRDQYLVYNLTGLYTEHPNPWIASDPSDASRTFSLQMCNPITSVQRASGCKNKYAEICEIANGREINRGSTLTHLKLANNSIVIQATIDNGGKCSINGKESQHKTVIEFSCSFKNSGPIYEYMDNCTVNFSWKTKHACPYYNETCISDDNQIRQCKLTVEEQDFEVIAPKTVSNNGENLVFKFNLCGEVNDDEAPCMKGVSVIMKNLSEPNVKQRIVSLGKFSNASIKNNYLVFKYNTGHYCELGDYKSEIRVECSAIEHEPIVVDHDNKCHYVFLWKTKYGCPLLESTKRYSRYKNNCSFTYNGTDERVDLGHVKPFTIHDQRVTLDILVCEKAYLKCSENGNSECVKKTLFNNRILNLSNNSANLILTSSRPCVSPSDLNEVLIRFICQGDGQEFIKSRKRNDCSLIVDYGAKFACSLPGHLGPPTKTYIEVNDVQIRTKHSPKTNLLQVVKSCPIVSQFSDYELNIQNVSNKFLNHQQCPSTVEFDNTAKFVKLYYPTTDVCRSVASKNISYQVYLMCHHDEDVIPENQDCLVHLSFNKMEYCNFFEPERETSVGLIVGSSIGCLVLFAALAGAGIIIRNKRICSSHIYTSDELVNIYQRNTKL